MNAFQVVRDFEKAICDYTGAPYCVTVTSCTAALFLACKYLKVETVTIPRRTYVSVPMSIIHAGGRCTFSDHSWRGGYRLDPYPIWDFARRFTSGMYVAGEYQCVSFHWAKILGIQQGGAILHDNREADIWFRKARFDGRTEGVHPKDDTFDMLGYHCYLSPEVAAEGLVRLSHLPKHNEDLPNDDYPDLSQIPLFQSKPMDAIRKIRAKNNDRWMDAIDRLAALDPEFFKTWQRDVRANDQQISELNRKLCE